jgi:hypothetical protein
MTPWPGHPPQESIVTGTNWRMPAELHSRARLPVEGELPSSDGATGWLNSPLVTPAGLRGKAALASFWTYTCINTHSLRWRRAA